MIEDGWIITNEHVVGSNKSVIVHIPMSNEGSGYTSFAGNVFGVDRKRDLAAIKLDHGLEPIKTREVDVRDIGKEVFTLGYSAGISNFMVRDFFSRLRFWLIIFYPSANSI